MDSHQLETLRLLRTVTPPALAHLSPSELARFRVAAEDDCKTGRSRAAIRMVKGLPTRCHLTPEGALFTLLFHVNAILRHREAQAHLGSQPYALVQGFGDTESCPYCQARSGKIYHAHEVDLPPFPACTCPRGCKCMLIYCSPESLAT